MSNDGFVVNILLIGTDTSALSDRELLGGSRFALFLFLKYAAYVTKRALILITST